MNYPFRKARHIQTRRAAVHGTTKIWTWLSNFTIEAFWLKKRSCEKSLENSLLADISLFISWANSYLLNQLLKYLGENYGVVFGDQKKKKKKEHGTSLVVQLLRLCAFMAEDSGLSANKIPYAIGQQTNKSHRKGAREIVFGVSETCSQDKWITCNIHRLYTRYWVDPTTWITDRYTWIEERINI